MIKEEIKLNLFLFNLISKYLIKNKSFLEILNIALLSKSTFKIIRNQITAYKQPCIENNKLKKQTFIITLKQLIQYIKNSNNNNNENYKFKLIQFKELEYLNIYIGDNDNELISFSNNSNNNNNKNKEIKSFLLNSIPNLKYVKILDKSIKVIPNLNYYTENSNLDYLCNGFFKIKILSLFWNKNNKPISYLENIISTYSINNFEIQYSFKFISNYFKPSKIYINTTRYKFSNNNNNNQDSQDSLDNYSNNKLYNPIRNLNNLLLNCKSIKSINFQFHPTPISFIKTYLLPYDNNDYSTTNITELNNQFNNLKSLIIIFEHRNPNLKFFNDILEKRIQISNHDDTSNSKLTKLIIKNLYDNYDLVNNDYNEFERLNSSLDPTEFLKLLLHKNNLINLKKLGLQLFNIKEFNQLSILSTTSSSIYKLYCNSHNLESHLNYCLNDLSSNITELKYNHYSNDTKILNIFNVFFNKLTTSSSTKLECIKCVIDDSNEDSLIFQSKLNTLYLNFKNEKYKFISLKFKKIK